jgi:predicted phage terminase large subunit-like protein
MTKTSRRTKQSTQQGRTLSTLGPIEQLPTAMLKPYANNARTHDERQIALIMASIEQFGFTNPIIAEDDGTIIAGHGRWEAAKELGVSHVPVLRAKDMTPQKVRAYRLADNRLAELAGWDMDMLGLELGYLDSIDLDFSIETIGWTHAEIDIIIDPPKGDSEGGRDPADEVIPEPSTSPVSRAGDLWLLGDHRLLVGSALDPDSFATLMDGRQAQMVCQDGPYNVPIDGHVSGLGRVKHAEFAMASGEMTKEEFQSFNADNLRAVIPHVVDGAIFTLCMPRLMTTRMKGSCRQTSLRGMPHGMRATGMPMTRRKPMTNDPPLRRFSFEQQMAALRRRYFLFYLAWVFKQLHPSEKLDLLWYIRAMCQALQQAARGAVRRLVINVPPRHLKSITASVAFATWMLGRNPRVKIMIVTYGGELARQHADQRRQIMEHRTYRSLFPDTKLAVRGIRQNLLRTTAGGGCRSVTVNGATTGFGADVIIIDDCMKADDIISQAMRDALERFYTGTLITRLNNKKRGLIISIQQRLGEDDLPARMLAAGAEHLCLPSYDDDKEAVFDIGFGRIYRRRQGELLRPDEEDRDTLRRFEREMGAYGFATQYLQRPSPLEGTLVRISMFERFNLDDFPREIFHFIVQSWDTATSLNTGSYSVGQTWGYLDGDWYLIHQFRERAAYTRLRDMVMALQKQYKADVVLIEDTVMGPALNSDLAKYKKAFRPIMIRPEADKVTRMAGQTGFIEDGKVFLPNEAPWLDPLLSELRAFPNAPLTDQVDTMSQFLEWAKRKDGWAAMKIDPRTGRREAVNRPEFVRRLR